MPFAKSATAKKSYTGLNLLKSYWKAIIDNVNSTPYHQTEAVNNLMYLCAETEEERDLRKLALLAFYGKRLGYKQSAPTDEVPDPLDAKVAELMSRLKGA